MRDREVLLGRRAGSKEFKAFVVPLESIDRLSGHPARATAGAIAPLGRRFGLRAAGGIHHLMKAGDVQASILLHPVTGEERIVPGKTGTAAFHARFMTRA